MRFSLKRVISIISYLSNNITIEIYYFILYSWKIFLIYYN